MRRQMQVNLLGPGAADPAPACRRSPAARGRVINVSSLAGENGLPMNSFYCASKFALEGLSEALQPRTRRARRPGRAGRAGRLPHALSRRPRMGPSGRWTRRASPHGNSPPIAACRPGCAPRRAAIRRRWSTPIVALTERPVHAAAHARRPRCAQPAPAEAHAARTRIRRPRGACSLRRAFRAEPPRSDGRPATARRRAAPRPPIASRAGATRPAATPTARAPAWDTAFFGLDRVPRFRDASPAARARSARAVRRAACWPRRCTSSAPASTTARA